MRYPNVRFADPAEFSRCCAGYSLQRLARMLRHDQATVQAWLDGKRLIPWWALQILRLKRMEMAQAASSMK